MNCMSKLPESLSKKIFLMANKLIKVMYFYLLAFNYLEGSILATLR